MDTKSFYSQRTHRVITAPKRYLDNMRAAERAANKTNINISITKDNIVKVIACTGNDSINNIVTAARL